MMDDKIKKDFIEVPMDLIRALSNIGKKEPGIEIPESVIEALLTAEARKDHAGVEAVCNEIRELSENQSPNRFRSDRHGTR